MPEKVIIVGAGQLGSRYLQGLAKVTRPLEIFVVDSSAESLERARERWDEVAGGDTKHSLTFLKSLQEAPTELDLAIVATTADSRPDVVEGLAGRSQVRYWVLEKVLAQSEAAIARIEAAVANSAGCWVNTPMFMWTLYTNLKKAYGDGAPVKAFYEDVRGLACNAIHYVDLIARWNGAAPEKVETSGIDGNWYDAQRVGFSDIYGALKVTFSDGSELTVTSKEKDRTFRVKWFIHDEPWTIRENDGVAESQSGATVEGACEFQSDLTPRLVDAIFDTGTCALPTLAESAAQHRVYLKDLLEHWNRTMPAKTERLPIT